jgi:hypothetical protein
MDLRGVIDAVTGGLIVWLIVYLGRQLRRIPDLIRATKSAPPLNPAPRETTPAWLSGSAHGESSASARLTTPAWITGIGRATHDFSASRDFATAGLSLGRTVADVSLTADSVSR